jgi:hypothetical protein
MTSLSLEIEAEKLPESEWLWLKGYLKEVFFDWKKAKIKALHK